MANDCIIRLKEGTTKEELKNSLKKILRDLIPKEIKVNIGTFEQNVFFWLGKSETYDSATTDLLSAYWIKKDEQGIFLISEHKQRYNTTWWLKNQITFSLWKQHSKLPVHDERIGDFTPEKSTFEEYLDNITKHKSTPEGKKELRQFFLTNEKEAAIHDPSQALLLKHLLPPDLLPLSAKQKPFYEDYYELRKYILRFGSKENMDKFPCDKCCGNQTIKNHDDYDPIEGMKLAETITCPLCKGSGVVREDRYLELLKQERIRVAARNSEHSDELDILISLKSKLSRKELDYINNRFR